MTFKKFFLLALVAIFGIAGLTFWNLYRVYTYRYRLTFEVETPEGLKTGSGVIEVHTRKLYFSLAGYGATGDYIGEAVPVDLGPRGVLFAVSPQGPEYRSLGGGDWFRELPITVFGRLGAIDLNGYFIARERSMERLRAKGELINDELPLLVHFHDLNDPKTIKQVDPKDLSKSFGAGVRLKSVIIEMTREPITTGIDKKLPWLKHLKTGSIVDNSEYLSQNIRPPTTLYYLQDIYFQRGTQR